MQMILIIKKLIKKQQVTLLRIMDDIFFLQHKNQQQFILYNESLNQFLYLIKSKYYFIKSMLISTLIKYAARKVKVNMAAQAKSQQTKTKFTENEILQMAGHKLNSRSTIKVFKDKLQQKMKTKKKQQGDQYDEQEDSFSYQKTIKKPKSQYLKYKSPHLQKNERITPQQITLKQLSRIRLSPQYLPTYFMQKAKKVFHKYTEPQLRQIAEHFAYYTKLRYSQEKIDYEVHQDLGFQKLELKRLPGGPKPEEPIYLIGKDKIYEQKQEQAKMRKTDDDPINNDISYTQNIVVSYLLLRMPKTYGVAARLLNQIKYKYDNFKPQSFIDFGAGLSSGCLAYIDTFPEENQQIYAVQPAPKMRKMSQYLNSDKIQYYKSLGQLSLKVRAADIVYAGYVLNQIDSQLVEVYLQSLWTKVKNQGFLVLVQHGTPFGARIIHEARKWVLKKQHSQIAAPCSHHMKCPLARLNQWCHFDQPIGMYPREVFGKLPNDNQVKSQKFSYLIIQKTLKDEIQQEQKPNITNEWDRILFPLLKRGGHFALNLCTKKGTFERRVIAKSHGEEHKEGKKLKWGDLWRFGHRIPNKFRKQRVTGKRLW